jgi:NAD(P)-dependent dehydrogenase (short-subunit alcohol dehydrogenase family)
MRVFVAGASGAIGQPLITELGRQGHTVTGMTRSEGDVAEVFISHSFQWDAIKTVGRTASIVALYLNRGLPGSAVYDLPSWEQNPSCVAPVYPALWPIDEVRLHRS